MNHKWDIITDICDRCGIKKQTKQLFVKGELLKYGKLTEYFINGKWVTERPKCELTIKEAKRTPDLDCGIYEEEK